MEYNHYFPITSEQKLLQAMELDNPRKDAANISSIMYFDTEIDVRLMQQAINLALLRCPSANVRLHKEKGELMQYFSLEAPLPIEMLDYSQKSQEELHRDAEKWSMERFPNRGKDTQLYEVRLILQPNGRYAMYFRVSHYILDGYAMTKVMTDMVNYYGCLRDGKAIPPVKGDYMKICKELWDYEESEKRQQDLKYMEDFVFDTEPNFSPICPEKVGRDKDGKKGKLFVLSKRGFRVNLRVKKDLVERVYAAAAKQGVSPQTYFDLGIYSSLSKINGDQEDIIFMNMVSRRGSAVKKNSYGSLATSLPLRASFDLDQTTVQEALQVYGNKLVKSYTHAGVALLELMKIMKEKYDASMLTNGYWTLATTFMPGFPVPPEGVRFHMEVFSNSYVPFPLYLFICSVDDSGDLNCSYECRIKQNTPETPHRFHAHLLKALEAMVENPSMTLRELNAQ